MVTDGRMKLEEEGSACEPPACRARSQCRNPSGREDVLNQSPSLKVTLSTSLCLSLPHSSSSVLSTLCFCVPAHFIPFSLIPSSLPWSLFFCLSLSLYLSIISSLTLLLLVTWYWSSPSLLLSFWATMLASSSRPRMNISACNNFIRVQLCTRL